MNVRATYNVVIELNTEETEALDKLLGELSIQAEEELGLSENQIKIINKLYKKLPHFNQ